MALTRRQLLAAAAVGSSTAVGGGGRGRAARRRQRGRVVVVGAGLAGLSAAHELERAGWEVVVLEARKRIGGVDRYADDLREGMRVRQGDVIGYVGTTGNAPASTPHLHFAIGRLTPEKRWWKSEAIDPYPILTAPAAPPPASLAAR